VNLLPLIALLPIIYLGVNTIFLHNRERTLGAYSHLAVAVAGFTFSTIAYGWQSTWASAVTGVALFIFLVWTGFLSRTLTFVIPVLAAMVPFDDYLILYTPAFALVAYIAIRDVIKKVSVRDVVNTAVITYTSPISNAAENARDTAKAEKANIPVLPLLGVGMNFSVMVYAVWTLLH